MKVSTKMFVVIVLMMSIVSAAILTEYFKNERELEVVSWLTYEVNIGPASVYGSETAIDYINVTSTRPSSVQAEIVTTVYYNGELLEDSTGLSYHYFVSTESGDIMPVLDTNNNGLPDVTIFGTENNNGFTAIKRKILTATDLKPGTYKFDIAVVPREM